VAVRPVSFWTTSELVIDSENVLKVERRNDSVAVRDSVKTFPAERTSVSNVVRLSVRVWKRSLAVVRVSELVMA